MRAIIVHGWDGSPRRDWYPWLKKELGKRNFEVEILRMPEPSQPTIEKWVGYLLRRCADADKETYFVGHSIGCQAIIRYLEKYGRQVGGAVFVAGWFMIKGLKTKEEKSVAKPWIETPLDWKRVKNAARNFIAIFSDDDPFVPLKGNRDIFEKKLGSDVIVESKKGHFIAEDGVTELPSALESVLKLATKKKS